MQNERILSKLDSWHTTFSNSMKLPTITADVRYTDECTLKRRIAPHSVVDKFINDLDYFFSEHIRDLNTLKTEFENNFRHAVNVDNVLGECENVENEEQDQVKQLEKSKDGTVRLRCPINKCGAKVFKLSRHLKKHNLNEEQRKLSFKISNVYARNTNLTELKINEHFEDFKNVKMNYKFCVICKSLMLNLCDHLRHTHGLLKDDQEYFNAMRSVTIIPACVVKKFGKANKLMSDAEIANLKINGSQITFPPSLFENVSMIREEIDRKTLTELVPANLDVVMNMPSTSKTSNFFFSSSTTPNFDNLKNIYMQYLTRLRRPNISQIIRTTFYILDDYSKRHSISCDQILNPKFISEILQEFLQKPSLTSTTKIKYICNFESLIKFLVKDSASPYFIVDASNEVIIGNNLRLEQVQREISNYRKTLSKDRGIDRIAAKEKRKISLITKDEERKLDHDSSSYITRLNSMEDVENMSKTEAIGYRDNFINLCFARMGECSEKLIIYMLLFRKNELPFFFFLVNRN